MSELETTLRNIGRRRMLKLGAAGLGGIAFAGMQSARAANSKSPIGQAPHYTPRAKRVIYLFQAGGPSQVDLFDPKPALAKHHGEDIFQLVKKEGRLTGFTDGHKIHPVINSKYKFAQHGENGAWMSELLPHMSGITDEFCTIRSLSTTPSTPLSRNTKWPSECRVRFRIYPIFRAHHLQSGWESERVLRPRPPCQLLHHISRRGRIQTGSRPRRDRRLLLLGRQG